MDITLIRDAVPRQELNDMAKQQFGDMVKAVVDIVTTMVNRLVTG